MASAGSDGPRRPGPLQLDVDSCETSTDSPWPTGSSLHLSQVDLDPPSPSRVMHSAADNGTCVVYTAGRPPWYNVAGEVKQETFVIGICGGTASGKTTVARHIVGQLGVPWVCLLSMDSFYKVLDAESLEKAHRNEFNFDHPDAFDFDLLIETLANLKQGKSCEVPHYDFSTHSRSGSTTMYGASVLIFEGIMAFASTKLMDLMDLKVFVDEDADVRLARRLKRDTVERGRDVPGAIHQYTTFVKPMFDQFIKPTMQLADLVLPRGTRSEAAMDMLVRHVKSQLKLRGLDLRKSLAAQAAGDTVVGGPGGLSVPTTLTVLPETTQLSVLHSIIRDSATPRDEFVFYSERVIRLVIEKALSLLPFEDVVVHNTHNQEFQGCRRASPVCGVSIIRAGLTMEGSLRSVVRDVPLGKILIQTNPKTREPELHFFKLPSDIQGSYVLLLDPTVATGAAAMMAIRVLRDHGVPEDQILFCTVVATPLGINSVAYAFPKVKIVTSVVDKGIDKNFHITPGVGNFGSRFYGTE
eukprot:m.245760 g.245760  ORF g.245760 m.245760 type:complete len:525 (+) comp19054_c0_seq4:2793-4367(+)